MCSPYFFGLSLAATHFRASTTPDAAKEHACVRNARRWAVAGGFSSGSLVVLFLGGVTVCAAVTPLFCDAFEGSAALIRSVRSLGKESAPIFRTSHQSRSLFGF